MIRSNCSSESISIVIIVPGGVFARAFRDRLDHWVCSSGFSGRLEPGEMVILDQNRVV